MRSTRQGSGPPLVLVHGLGARRESWQPLLAGLTPTREVVAVDLPDHGATPALTGELTFDRLVDALQKHLDSEGLSDAGLVDSSMGPRSCSSWPGAERHCPWGHPPVTRP